MKMPPDMEKKEKQKKKKRKEKREKKKTVMTNLPYTLALLMVP